MPPKKTKAQQAKAAKIPTSRVKRERENSQETEHNEVSLCSTNARGRRGRPRVERSFPTTTTTAATITLTLRSKHDDAQLAKICVSAECTVGGLRSAIRDSPAMTPWPERMFSRWYVRKRHLVCEIMPSTSDELPLAEVGLADDGTVFLEVRRPQSSGDMTTNALVCAIEAAAVADQRGEQRVGQMNNTMMALLKQSTEIAEMMKAQQIQIKDLCVLEKKSQTSIDELRKTLSAEARKRQKEKDMVQASAQQSANLLVDLNGAQQKIQHLTDIVSTLKSEIASNRMRVWTCCRTLSVYPESGKVSIRQDYEKKNYIFRSEGFEKNAFCFPNFLIRLGQKCVVEFLIVGNHIDFLVGFQQEHQSKHFLSETSSQIDHGQFVILSDTYSATLDTMPHVRLPPLLSHGGQVAIGLDTCPFTEVGF